MVLSIIETIFIVCMALYCVNILRGDNKKLSCTEDDLALCLITGIVVGAANYFSPRLGKFGMSWLIPIALLVTLAIMAGVIAYGKERACEWLEYFWLIALLTPMFYTARMISGLTAAMITDSFWESVIAQIPSLLYLAAFVIFAIDGILYRARKR